MIEQDHRFIKKRIWTMLGLKSLRTATKMIAGIEAMHMVKKGQLKLKIVTDTFLKSITQAIYFLNILLIYSISKHQ